MKLRSLLRSHTGALALSLLGACGVATPGAGNNNGVASVTGAIKGQAFAAVDAISSVATFGGSASAIVGLYDVTGSCDLYGQGKQRHGIKQLVLTLADVDAIKGTQSAPTKEGTYVIGPQTGVGSITRTATAAWASTTATCSAGDTAAGVSGSIALSSVNSGGIAGSGDITFDSGDHVTVSFIASTCAAWRGPGGGTPGCQ